MKKLLCILPFLFVLPLTGVAQSDSIITIKEEISSDNSQYKNEIDLDFEILAFSLSYKHKISKNWLIGPSFGIGPVVSLGFSSSKYGGDNFGAYFQELMHVGFVAKTYIKGSNKFSFELEPRFTISNFNDGKTYFSIGFGGGLFYGGKVQIGIRTIIGRFYEDDPVLFLTSNLFVLRLPRTW